MGLQSHAGSEQDDTSCENKPWMHLNVFNHNIIVPVQILSEAWTHFKYFKDLKLKHAEDMQRLLGWHYFCK